MRKLILGVGLFFAIAFVWASGVYAGASIEKIEAYLNHEIMFKIDGKVWIPKDQDGKALSPIVYDGASYLPVRAMAEATGVAIDWDQATKTILLNTKRDSSGEPYKDAKSYNGNGTSIPNTDSQSGTSTAPTSVFKYGTSDKPYSDPLFSMKIKQGKYVRWIDDSDGKHLMSMIVANNTYSEDSHLEFDTNGIYYSQMDFNFNCPSCSAANPVEVRVLTQDGVEAAKFTFTNTEKDYKMQGMTIGLNGPVSKVIIWVRSVSGAPIEFRILPTAKLDYYPN
ncbi:stalk domain-containing protein [Paenibacillus sp. GCM10027628]|uniref:stalk domain-containing protein n=1 Tax=Paenibacillus sp. GCM10027628 TaxID=3273413 RepID=UPI00363F3E72